MSNRRAGNRIRGPHSALTDFLAIVSKIVEFALRKSHLTLILDWDQANNISATQIRDEYERRRAQGNQQAAQTPANNNQAGAQDGGEAVAAVAEGAQASGSRSSKRKRTEEKATAKPKGRKAYKRNAKKKPSSDDEDDDYDNQLARDMYQNSKPLPGQLENCEICNKRFTVTPYSKSGPEGGLLCTPCGKELAADSKPDAKTKKAVLGKKRRKVESDRLDGKVQSGAKTLQQLCLEKVAANHVDLEEFGDLPQNLMQRLSEIFTKTRVLNSRTLKLFLRPDLDTIAIHDAAYLEPEDYQQVFAVVPHIEKLVLQNACQFKNEVMEYMIEKASKLKFLQLYAANLVSNDTWHKLFQVKGPDLTGLKLQWLDASFDDEVVQDIAKHCTNLQRLKFKLCRKISSAAIDAISTMSSLEHLTLQFSQDVTAENLVNLVHHVGAKLRTLCLEKFADADDTVLAAIHAHCRNLSKFRFCSNDLCTDEGYKALFNDWDNPPLLIADFNGTRDIDNTNPHGPEEAVGLASEGFGALMAHSGAAMQKLDISSCRHISHEAFSTVFNGEKKYSGLVEIDLSFCNRVDTVVVAGIFKSCPNLKKLTAFGCFEVVDVVVPAGVVLIGVPNAHDAIEQHGDSIFSTDQALAAMVEVAG